MENLKKYLGVFLAVMVAAAVLRSLDIDDKSGKITTGEILELNNQWEQTISEEEYSQYCYKIPERMSETMTLSLENSWTEIKIFLDGEEIYTYSDPYQEFGEQMAWIEIPGASGGKELTLEFYGKQKMAARVMKKPMYMGEKNAVLLRYLTGGLYALFFPVYLYCIMLDFGV